MCADRETTDRPQWPPENDSEPRHQWHEASQAPTMRALHLPGLERGSSKPPFSFPNSPPPPSALVYSTGFPRPKPPLPLRGTIYLVRVQYTALTKGELTWDETLYPHRWSEAGGAIPGHDILGTVEQYLFAEADSDGREPRKSPKFKVGEHVVALIAFDRDGAASEYAVAEEGELASIDSILSPATYPTAVTMPLSGLSAYQALFEHSGLQGGLHGKINKRVLILGASGNLGLQILQMAKRKGCWVSGTASTKKLDFVKGLGADEVIDHKIKPHVGTVWEEKAWEEVDIIIDTVGKSTLFGAMEEKIVKKGTTIVSLVAPFSAMGEGWEEKERWLEGRGGKFVFFIVKPNGNQLEEVMHEFAEHRLEGFAEKEIDLADGKEAMELTENGTSKGKVVLKI